MFQSIRASKLYRTSSRKDKIDAAFDNPINSELVGQLARALDEEYQTPEYLVKDKQDSGTEDTSKVSSEPTNDGPSSEVSEPSIPHSLPRSSNPGFDEFKQNDSNESSNETSDSQVSEETSTSDSSVSSEPTTTSEPVAESTNLKGSPVMASFPRSIFRDMRQVSDEIKGMLNFKDSTCGVNRILCKEGEFWIYYNDDVNLNNVMADVIELLNAAGYIYLEFNRLARTDNAIVFLIDFADTANIVQSDVVEKKDK